MMQIITHTPIWVFILFAVLLIFGFLQTRSRNVKFILAYLLPIGMVILSFVGVISSFGLKLIPICLWLAGISVISVLGYKRFPLKGAIYNAEIKSYFIPGSWISFGAIMAIFFIKYSVGVMGATNIPLIKNSIFVFALCLAYGALSGFFVSRAICLASLKKA